MRTAPRSLAALAAAVLALAVLSACSGDDDPPGAPKAQPTPLSAFEAEGVTVARTDFCDRVPEPAAEAAIGEVSDMGHYGNGDQVELAEGVRDVAHEYNCTFTAASGAEARVWVFAPAVTRKRAKALIAEAKDQKGCRVVGGQGFGKPTTGLLCRTAKGTEASYRGLFVDTWVTCSVRDPKKKADGAEMLERTGEWCVQAVTSASVETSPTE